MNMSMNLKRAWLLVLLSLMLAACGGDDETRYVDREKPTPVEYMPVDGYVMGFWVMDQQRHCDGACINDHSPYGDALYATDDQGQPVTPVLQDGGVVGRIAVFRDQYRLSTRHNSTFSNTLIGDRFTLHLRARTDRKTAQPVLSLVTAAGARALTLSLGRGSILASLPSQSRRLLGDLKNDEGWREIVLASDGEQVTLAVDCNVLARFAAAPGEPVLSSEALGLVVGAGFTGAVDLVRVSRRHEGNLFCPEGSGGGQPASTVIQLSTPRSSSSQ